MVDGSDEYLAMMQRLSKSTAKPSDSLYQGYLRRLNKALGRPATQDVGILSSVLSKVKAETENQLSTSIDRVVVTTPHFEALTREDLHDGLEYVGLPSPLMAHLNCAVPRSDVRSPCCLRGKWQRSLQAVHQPLRMPR